MKRKAWILAAGAFVLTLGGSAVADISRTADGKYVLLSTTFRSASGRVLRTIVSDANHSLTRHYVSAIGRYGGGDTASGRRLAKRRAIDKVYQCMTRFFTKGLLDPSWGLYCGRASGDYSVITDPDITLISNWYAYFTFENIAQDIWCTTALQLAQQAGESGPVTISGDVGMWGDAAGTEEDVRWTIGSYSTTCYPF